MINKTKNKIKNQTTVGAWPCVRPPKSQSTTTTYIQPNPSIRPLRKEYPNNTGITLIALVITIIVLLILAGVTLSLVMGNDGILGRAEKAVNETDISSGKEQTELLVADYLAEYYKETYVNANQDVAMQKAEEYIQGQITETGKATSSGDYFVTIDAENKIMVYKDTSVVEINKIAEGTLLSGGKVEWGSSGNGSGGDSGTSLSSQITSANYGE